MKKIIFLTTAFLASFLGNAQEFLHPSETFSHKEISYFTLTDGTEIQGTVHDIDRKKGLIEEIVIKDENGKKRKFKPEEVKFMYLKPNNLSKLVNIVEITEELNNITDKKLDKVLLGKGYVYFENVPVMIKKKKYTMLMQLLNPDFSSKIRVYHDPYAKETTKLGIGGVSFAGGIDKSYYISKDGEVAYKIEKSDYDDAFAPMFQSCKTVIDKYQKDVKWRDFPKHVYEYTTECK